MGISTNIWPDENERESMNKIIISSQIAPFEAAAYNPQEKVIDFVGRKQEIFDIHEELRHIFLSGMSHGIKLQGEGGVGKSTLFNYIKESIDLQRVGKLKIDNWLSHNLNKIDILSTYFRLPTGVSQFSDIWIPLSEGLKATFDQEVPDVTLMEYIALQIILHMLRYRYDKVSDILYQGSEKNKLLNDLSSIKTVMQGKQKKIVEDLIKFYTENKTELRELMKTTINDKNFEITRKNNNLIIDLFRCLDEDDPTLDEFCQNSSAGKRFSRDEDLIQFFNDLLNIYTAVTKKKPILLIGIDEVAKSPNSIGIEEYYINLGNFFCKLRDSLRNTLFVFISTTQDWSNFDDALVNKSDLNNQLSAFLKNIQLTQLDVIEILQIYKNRMNRFWDNYPDKRVITAQHYPFSDESFEYILRFNRRDLRNSIIELNTIWRQFKFKSYIPKLHTYFDTMQYLHQIKHQPILPSKLNQFEWQIITKYFADNPKYNTSSLRSSAVEKGFESAFKCLQLEQPSNVTSVKNNPVILIKDSKRRPDILIGLKENLGTEFRRYLEIQVKVYKEDNEVDLSHIQSSLELFENGYTDFIYFIITGSGLNSKAEDAVKKLENEFKGRIRRNPLNEVQKNYISFLALYSDITGLRFDDIKNKEENLTIVRELFKVVFGQNIEDLFKEVSLLPYRNLAGKMEVISEEQKAEEKKEDNIKIPTGILNPPDKVKPPEIPNEFSLKKKWVIDFPMFEVFQNELEVLLTYLMTRDGTSSAKKFTIKTVETNCIVPNAACSKESFNFLVKKMISENYIVQEKLSFKLTENGDKLYSVFKQNLPRKSSKKLLI